MAELGPHDAYDKALDQRGAELWADAWLAIELLRIGGAGIGGLWLKARSGGVRDLFLSRLLERLGTHVTRLPPGTSATNLVGGVDIAATAAKGSLVRQKGLLARAEGGVLIIPMAERLDASLAAMVANAMDQSATKGFLLIALDESLDDEAPLSGGIADRLALRIDLDGIGWHHVSDMPAPDEATTAPAADWRDVTIDDKILKGLASLTHLAGHRSSRMLTHLARTARLLACCDGRSSVEERDALTALRLCLGLRLAPPAEPASTEPEDPSSDPPPQLDQPGDIAASNHSGNIDQNTETGKSTQLDALTDMLSAIQAGALSADPWLSIAQRPTRSAGTAGKSGGLRKNARRGRPFGIGLAPPHPEARPDIIATLRAAAPFQRIRAAQRQAVSAASSSPLVEVRAPRAFVTRDDFRYVRLRHAAPSTAIFVVDASGSTALERLGETKGAIEHLLTRCYVRRDEVALIAFRGKGAELLLPPTRSLTAAKRKLAGLPGGGPTPLAAGLKAAMELALSVERRGSSPVLVLLTDGSGNIALDGTPDRALAAEELTRLATTCKARDIKTICIDIARRPRESVTNLATMLGADLHVLRKADAGRVSNLVDRSMQEARA
ncbi:VWA domain-containing protein [Rhizobium sp. AG855]|uniref:VWA domain-containing protein n=1 Tax=Rhizobium sp. AG855 TaxID=2183898 RepID=UPI000FF1E390|nr:VWA domain-containing protein [Rhizobium sp. AG855]RKE79522.1 magnesium chelatase subunit D [Rhizobium sp. AG855]